MSRLLVSGGLFIEAVSSLLSLPGVSEASMCGATALGAVMVVLPAAYKLLAGPFSIVLEEATV